MATPLARRPEADGASPWVVSSRVRHGRIRGVLIALAAVGLGFAALRRTTH